MTHVLEERGGKPPPRVESPPPRVESPPPQVGPLKAGGILQLHVQLQLQLHYTTLHPAVVVRWPLQPLQPLQKIQLQPPFGPSVDSLCHRKSQQPTLPLGVSYFWNFRHRCALLITWKLRSPVCRNSEFPRVGSYVSQFWNKRVSFPRTASEKVYFSLGIRLNINFWNKLLLSCLMVRQKDVYTCVLFFIECTCTRCCTKKAAMVLFNWPASKKAHVENKSCILDRRETHVLWNNRCVLIISQISPVRSQ